MPLQMIIVELYNQVLHFIIIIPTINSANSPLGQIVQVCDFAADCQQLISSLTKRVAVEGRRKRTAK